MRWKVAVVTALFVLGALCFFAGYFPVFSSLFWVLWILGCGSCIAGLVVAVIVPRAPATTDRPLVGD